MGFSYGSLVDGAELPQKCQEIYGERSTVLARRLDLSELAVNLDENTYLQGRAIRRESPYYGIVLYRSL